MKNNSPWIYQLDHSRQTGAIRNNTESDILIIGGGIAGACSAYYSLKNTEKAVTLIEAKKIAHGATGHNAGYVVAEFEKPFQEIAKEYGLDKARAGIEAIESAWDHLFEIIKETEMDITLDSFIGYGGYSHFDQFLLDVTDEYLMNPIRADADKILISIESRWKESLKPEIRSICKEVPQSVLLRKLETKNSIYHAALPRKVGVANTALFTEKLLLYCLNTYPDRFTLFEHSPIHRVKLKEYCCISYSGEYMITSQEVVLCTNGFENFSIENEHGADIDTKFHHDVKGVVGYMSGYTSHIAHSPGAYFYYPGNKINTDPYVSEPYFYLTRRKFRHHEAQTDSLVSIGGPEVYLDDRDVYEHEHEIKEDVINEINGFVEKNFDENGLEPRFFWHGLMGYTTTGIRLVGHEPCNPRLLYNLGCNGIGVLPSVYGGWKIGQHLSGVKMEDTIFDPKDKTCAVPLPPDLKVQTVH